MQQIKTTRISGDFASATGNIEYGFTNDYMFRVVLQKNKKVLKSLICALLHLKSEEVISVEITNPIVLGETIADKDFMLDIHVSLNNNTNINLEMQVQNLGNWTERSLSYLCRSFDNLNSGDDYKDATPAIHIGFLDFTLFPEVPEFYATYRMMNVKNHHLYSSKFTLSVVDLTKIDLATAEDKTWGIDHWARLFKATTWEEIKMIAKNSETLQEASETLYSMHCEETIRGMARARQDYNRLHNYLDHKIATLEADNEKLTSDNEKLTSDVEKLSSDNEKLSSDVEKLSSALAEKDAEIAALRAQAEQKPKR